MFFDEPFYKQIIPTSSLLLEKKGVPWLELTLIWRL